MYFSLVGRPSAFFQASSPILGLPSLSNPIVLLGVDNPIILDFNASLPTLAGLIKFHAVFKTGIAAFIGLGYSIGE